MAARPLTSSSRTHAARKQISLEEFRNTAQALTAYSEREEQYRHDSRVEVVLLGAESIDAIKVTHSNYSRTQPTPSRTFSPASLESILAEQTTGSRLAS